MSDLDHRKRLFCDMVLAGTFDNDRGGRQPERRVNIRKMFRQAIDGKLEPGVAAAEIQRLLTGPRANRDVLTGPDFVVLGILVAKYGHHDPQLRTAAALGDHIWTRLFTQSGPVRTAYGLDDPLPTPLPIDPMGTEPLPGV